MPLFGVNDDMVFFAKHLPEIIRPVVAEYLFHLRAKFKDSTVSFFGEHIDPDFRQMVF